MDTFLLIVITEGNFCLIKLETICLNNPSAPKIAETFLRTVWPFSRRKSPIILRPRYPGDILRDPIVGIGILILWIVVINNNQHPTAKSWNKKWLVRVYSHHINELFSSSIAVHLLYFLDFLASWVVDNWFSPLDFVGVVQLNLLENLSRLNTKILVNLVSFSLLIFFLLNEFFKF